MENMKKAGAFLAAIALSLSFPILAAGPLAASPLPAASIVETPVKAADATPKATVSISGSITNNLGTPICGLVLANGQFVFSCSPAGTYSLDVRLDSAGQVTLFALAEGHFPFKVVLGGGGHYDIVLQSASSAGPANPNRDKTSQLLGGTWTYTYTILSTFSDSYTFTNVSGTPDKDGNYFASGTTPSGRLVVGGYVAASGQWAVLSQGIIIDQFYTFTFGSNNNVSGCYYQVNPPGSGNLSRCYPMTGFRSPPKSMAFESNQEQLVRDVAADAVKGEVEPPARVTYQALRKQAQQ